MIVFLNDKLRVSIEIEGYAYPFPRDDWDSNWLSVKIHINDYISKKEYEKNDTCLLTMELKDLRDWFLKVQDNSLVETEIKFIEPSLSFSCSANFIKIILKYNLNPLYNEKFDEPYIMEIKKDSVDYYTVINYLNEYIRQFPPKGNPK